MDEKIEKWLYDIAGSISEIELFITQNQIMSYSDYKNNLIVKRAIERNLEIIGEAMNRILKNDNTYAAKIPESKSIIGLRNQIIHAYDGISDESIWAIIIRHLPELKL